MTTPPDPDRPTAHSEAPRTRASDEDRAATVRTLQDALVRGLLTPDEGSDRMAAAWAAVHVRDLGPLTADLPATRPIRTPPGWAVLATMAVEQARSSLSSGRSGGLSRTRVAGALAVALLLVLLIGSAIGEVLFDGGPGRGGFRDR